MRRREFIAGLGGAAAWPLTARAQQGERLRRVGVLISSSSTETLFQSYLAAFVQGLRQLGWTEGQNLRIDVRWNAGDAGLARTYAAQLIELMPDVIMAGSTVNLKAIQQVTSTVPVVFVQVADPVAQGFVASVRQPGGNITGFSLYQFSFGSKWLGLLKEVSPGLERIAIITLPVRATADIEPALESFARQPNGGLILLGDSFTVLRYSLITDLAGRYRLPSFGTGYNFAKDGGLMEYGNAIDLVDQYRGAATYVDRILKGSKPSDLPVQAPDRYTLIINLKTAKALGLTIPETLLATADEVIQ
jgi:putative ABC transport system substrate-binding protein